MHSHATEQLMPALPEAKVMVRDTDDEPENGGWIVDCDCEGPLIYSLEAGEGLFTADQMREYARSYATALCQQGEPTEELGTLFDLVMYGDRGNPEKLRREIARLLSLYSHAHAERDAKDAARYRLLRSKVGMTQTRGIGPASFVFMNMPQPTYIAPDAAVELDAAIDAALSTSEGKTE